MEALYILVPLSLVMVGLAIWFFFRMSDSGQFDDLEGPAHIVLMDDDRPRTGAPPPEPVPPPEPMPPAAPGSTSRPTHGCRTRGAGT